MNTIIREPVLYILKTDAFSDPSVFEDCLKLLPEVRRQAALKYRRIEDRKRSLAASLLLLHVLKESGLSGESMRFSFNEHGKPFLENNPFFFSLSHSGDAGLCAASRGIIGCDVEALRPPVMAIAKLHFCPGEYRYLNGITDPGRQSRAFCRLWTLKESVVKAIGCGITIPLESFCISPDAGRTIVKTENLETAVFYKEYDAGENLCVSCSVFDPEHLPARLQQLTLSDLLCHPALKG